MTPCPKCKSHRWFIERRWDLNQNREIYNVICQECGYAGPFAETSQLAIRFWKEFQPAIGIEDSDVIAEARLLNGICSQLRTDLLERKYECYKSPERDWQNEYERGVCEAINLIEYRVHCMLDD